MASWPLASSPRQSPTGAVAVLLADACVAPVVIQVVLFASDRYASSASAALALPFLLGLGMALLWPIASAGLAALPRPGAWMVRVKYVFGIFILGTAVCYASVAYGIFANRWVDPATVAAASRRTSRKAGTHRFPRACGSPSTIARRC